VTRASQSLTSQKHRLDWSLVRKALLIRLRSIGDTVLMTASLRALKCWRPDIEIAVLSEPLAAPILDSHPFVDDLIIAEKSLAARARLISRLRGEKFDIAFNMHGGTTATIIAALAGAKHTFGYRGHRHSWMLDSLAPSPDVILGRARVHSVEQQLALLHWAGVPWPARGPQLDLVVSPEAEACVCDKLAKIGITERAAFACVSPAAALESKRWDAAGFAAVTDHLSEYWNLRSVIIAGPGQEHIAREVAEATKARAKVLTGLSLKELIALIGLAQMFVGNDSGPMHVAAALKRPLVAVFGSSNANVWHPWTDSAYRVIEPHKDESAEALRQSDATNVNDLSSSHSRPEIRDIPASRVIEEVDEVLKLAAGASFRVDANLRNR
jgi:lipopolysaccharide heptosyltransferase II